MKKSFSSLALLISLLACINELKSQGTVEVSTPTPTHDRNRKGFLRTLVNLNGNHMRGQQGGQIPKSLGDAGRLMKD
jgi:hypothetical protein